MAVRKGWRDEPWARTGCSGARSLQDGDRGTLKPSADNQTDGVSICYNLTLRFVQWTLHLTGQAQSRIKTCTTEGRTHPLTVPDVPGDSGDWRVIGHQADVSAAWHRQDIDGQRNPPLAAWESRSSAAAHRLLNARQTNMYHGRTLQKTAGTVTTHVGALKTSDGGYGRSRVSLSQADSRSQSRSWPNPDGSL